MPYFYADSQKMQDLPWENYISDRNIILESKDLHALPFLFNIYIFQHEGEREITGTSTFVRELGLVANPC